MNVFIHCVIHIYLLLLLSSKTVISNQSSYFISGWLDTGRWSRIKCHFNTGFGRSKLFIVLLFNKTL